MEDGVVRVGIGKAGLCCGLVLRGELGKALEETFRGGGWTGGFGHVWEFILDPYLLVID